MIAVTEDAEPAHRTGNAISMPNGHNRWQKWALASICILAATLYSWALGSHGWGNPYYTAAVKSMSASFTNFLFGSFDPVGVVTVDKPPMALWPQVAATMIFGFHRWSVLLPQVFEGVAAVWLLHRAVRRWAGANAALLAALILALTPITVAINRDNNPDSLLVLWLVAAAYALIRSLAANDTPRSHTLWLLGSAFFIGCGFVTKMMEAWIVVPAFGVAYLFGSTAGWKRRIGDLAAAAGVLLIASFWWNLLHDLWPGSKPYMGGSTDGTAWNLIFGYNGFGRVFGNEHGFVRGMRPGDPDTSRAGDFGGMFGGDTGPGRMFSDSVGGQISWLLPLALLVLVVVAVTGIRRMLARQPGDPLERGGWLLWGGSMLIIVVVFSYAHGIWHPYYTTILAPPIAAIAGAGLVRFWRYYRRPDGHAWLLLPIGIVITAGWAYVLASRDTSWNGWTRFVLVALAVPAVAGLVLAKSGGKAARLGLVLGLAAMFFVPAVWSGATALRSTSGGAMTSAGPPSAGFTGAIRRFSEVGGMPNVPGMPDAAELRRMFQGGHGGFDGTLSDEQRRILNYAKANSGGAEITLAVEGGAMAASPFILGSDDTIIGMGGFMGSDNTPSVRQLQQWVRQRELKFVLTTGRRGGPGDIADSVNADQTPDGFGGFGAGGGARAERMRWIEQHCTPVVPSRYGGHEHDTDTPQFGPFGGASTLYSCTVAAHS